MNLDELKEQIVSEWTEFDRSSYDRAMRLGALLLKAKKAVSEEMGHGAWKPWVSRNLGKEFGLKYRTAARYMKIAKPASQKILKSADSAHLTLTQAEEMLAQNKPKNGKSGARALDPGERPFKRACAAYKELREVGEQKRFHRWLRETYRLRVRKIDPADMDGKEEQGAPEAAMSLQ